MIKAHGLLNVLAACILVIALSSNSFIHSMIAHSHGEDHGHSKQSTELPAWTSLHHALTHESKKFPVLAFVGLIASAGVLAYAASLRCTFSPLQAAIARSRDPNAGEALRRGILPHRKFV